jgi:hypothetical protein
MSSRNRWLTNPFLAAIHFVCLAPPWPARCSVRWDCGPPGPEGLTPAGPSAINAPSGRGKHASRPVRRACKPAVESVEPAAASIAATIRKPVAAITAPTSTPTSATAAPVSTTAGLVLSPTKRPPAPTASASTAARRGPSTATGRAETWAGIPTTAARAGTCVPIPSRIATGMGCALTRGAGPVKPGARAFAPSRTGTITTVAPATTSAMGILSVSGADARARLEILGFNGDSEPPFVGFAEHRRPERPAGSLRLGVPATTAAAMKARRSNRLVRGGLRRSFEAGIDVDLSQCRRTGRRMGSRGEETRRHRRRWALPRNLAVPSPGQWRRPIGRHAQRRRISVDPGVHRHCKGD